METKKSRVSSFCSYYRMAFSRAWDDAFKSSNFKPVPVFLGILATFGAACFYFFLEGADAAYSKIAWSALTTLALLAITLFLLLPMTMPFSHWHLYEELKTKHDESLNELKVLKSQKIADALIPKPDNRTADEKLTESKLSEYIFAFKSCISQCESNNPVVFETVLKTDTDLNHYMLTKFHPEYPEFFRTRGPMKWITHPPQATQEHFEKVRLTSIDRVAKLEKLLGPFKQS